MWTGCTGWTCLMLMWFTRFMETRNFVCGGVGHKSKNTFRVCLFCHAIQGVILPTKSLIPQTKPRVMHCQTISVVIVRKALSTDYADYTDDNRLLSPREYSTRKCYTRVLPPYASLFSNPQQNIPPLCFSLFQPSTEYYPPMLLSFPTLKLGVRKFTSALLFGSVLPFFTLEE